MKSLVRTVAPTLEPVSLEEAMTFLRVDNNDEAPQIEALIAVAREAVEDFTGRALLTQTWKLTLPVWPEMERYGGLSVNAIALERSPLASVSSVKYYPASGGAQATVSSADYHVLTGPQPGMIVLAATADWPSLADRPDAVEITFVAGATTAADVPSVLRQCVLLLLSHLYELRAPVNVGASVNELPFSLKYLLESQRVGGWTA